MRTPELRCAVERAGLGREMIGKASTLRLPAINIDPSLSSKTYFSGSTSQVSLDGFRVMSIAALRPACASTEQLHDTARDVDVYAGCERCDMMLCRYAPCRHAPCGASVRPCMLSQRPCSRIVKKKPQFHQERGTAATACGYLSAT